MNRLLSLSLDLDDKWTYLKTHGDPAWSSMPSYLSVVIPRVLRFLAERELKITFFVVGRDAALASNATAFAAIAQDGHEIANHSFNHEPWLQTYSEESFEAELVDAEHAIESATGQRPVGFRGPGFSLPKFGPAVLARRGYLYDATTFPTFVGPLARAYMFLRSDFTREQKKERAALFGSLKNIVRANTSHMWDLPGALPLVEIPVTTLPFLRLPIHVSYLMYLARFSRTLAERYCAFALAVCRWNGVQPSVLLHPTDFIDINDAPEMAFFPAIHVPVVVKEKVLASIMRIIVNGFDVVTMREHAVSLRRALHGA